MVSACLQTRFSATERAAALLHAEKMANET